MAKKLGCDLRCPHPKSEPWGSSLASAPKLIPADTHIHRYLGLCHSHGNLDLISILALTWGIPVLQAFAQSTDGNFGFLSLNIYTHTYK